MKIWSTNFSLDNYILHIDGEHFSNLLILPSGGGIVSEPSTLSGQFLGSSSVSPGQSGTPSQSCALQMYLVPPGQRTASSALQPSLSGCRGTGTVLDSVLGLSSGKTQRGLLTKGSSAAQGAALQKHSAFLLQPSITITTDVSKVCVNNICTIVEFKYTKAQVKTS